MSCVVCVPLTGTAKESMMILLGTISDAASQAGNNSGLDVPRKRVPGRKGTKKKYHEPKGVCFPLPNESEAGLGSLGMSCIERETVTHPRWKTPDLISRWLNRKI